MKYLFYSLILHVLRSAPQFNVYNTDPVNEGESHFQEHCLRVTDLDRTRLYSYWFYCLGESPLKFQIEKNDLFPKYTFDQLYKDNVTSQQLYHWSAPIDLIERYQFYIDHVSKSSDYRHTEKDIFYQCQLPRFGPLCEYEFEYYYPASESFFEIINHYYQSSKSNSNDLTCYTHIRCNRGYPSSCLDWSEICDGVIDCIDDGQDEKHCWQLEINQCNENEYRCKNGQCIPQSFYGDQDKDSYDCLDGSDQVNTKYIVNHLCEFFNIPFKCEDIKCERKGLTSSCDIQRQHLLVNTMFSMKDPLASDQCWFAFKCLMYIYPSNDLTCENICNDNACVEIIKRECPNGMFIPQFPILFNQIYLYYDKNTSDIFYNGQLWYLYICHNNSDYKNYFLKDSMININHFKCYHHKYQPSFNALTHPSQQPTMFDIYDELWRYYQVFDYDSKDCNRTNIYQCRNSNKCISKSRRNDQVVDCPESDDENPDEIPDPNIVYPLVSLNNYWSQYFTNMIRYIRMNISFQVICDGYTDLYPILINGINHTDETECEQWECNNIYTHCNERWNCFNGADELYCDYSSSSDCPSDSHQCVSASTYQIMCLPIEKSNDGQIDCLGATDEPKFCRQNYEFEFPDRFYCLKNKSQVCLTGLDLCDNEIHCDNSDDEIFCADEPLEDEGDSDYCYTWHPPNGLTDIEKTLCKIIKGSDGEPFVFFSILGIRTYHETKKKTIEYQSSLMKRSSEYERQCHYGLDIRLWLNQTDYVLKCFCPPNFYGDRCQYQNDRVILSMKFRALSDSWETLFSIIIFLIDDSDDRRIHSFEQISYLTNRDCQRKFNVYLLYADQMKNFTKNYSIHIDIYEKFSLKYRGSLLFPIEFSYLPVHHLSIIIDIPQKSNTDQKCLDNRCIHGQCMKYSNNLNLSYCHCDRQWTGRYCEKKLVCDCSYDSLCIGKSSSNRSVCVCPPEKFGPRCLINTICSQTDQTLCENNAQCIPDDYFTDYQESFQCLCPKGFIGKRCENQESKILLSFEENLLVPETIFIHFIRIVIKNFPTRSTTFLANPLKKHSLTFYWSQPFHLAFIEIPLKKYYLLVIQRSTPSGRSIIKKKISFSDNCPHVNEIFNETFRQMHLIRQIKYYHLACQLYRYNLSCFYDQIHLCLCYTYEQKRLANCFQFDHNQTMNCLGKSGCENEGQCFQDDPNCPKRSVCLCRECFYGRSCQFYTSGFGLSLDGILSYHIRPNMKIKDQPIILHISLGLTISFFIVGLVNGFISMITFHSKVVREVGCGLYLLSSSITTLFITVLFGLKYSILILSQMNILTDKIFLSIQCYSIDFLLRICLNIVQWLNSCVAIERAYIAIKNARFSKKKSKYIAKIVLIILLIINIGSSIHDPIYRKLIEEENDGVNQKRIWCIVTYSDRLQLFNSVAFIFHFIGPFLLNLISSITLIMKKTLQKSRLDHQILFRILLKEQIQEHKGLLFAPIILVILGIPRLILSLVAKCMRSTNDSWIFLIGYFLSFLPPMLTALLFIYPSTFYKKELRRIISRYKIILQRRLRLTI